MAGMLAYDELTVIEALGVALGGATGLKAYRMFDSSLETPAAIPTMAPEWNAGFGGRVKSPIDCDILILCGIGDLVSGPLTLFEYTSATGSRSVKLALESDPTLGGAITDLRVVGPLTKTYERYDADGNLALVGRYIRVQIYP